jgi:hypothetical protein
MYNWKQLSQNFRENMSFMEKSTKELQKFTCINDIFLHSCTLFMLKHKFFTQGLLKTIWLMELHISWVLEMC